MATPKAKKEPAKMLTLDEMLAEINQDTVLLSFSRGKDAWGCWCALRDKVDIQPFHYYVGIPHLTFVDEYLAYAEKIMGKEIITLPPPQTLRRLSPEPADQPPNRLLVLQAFDLKAYTFEELQDLVKEICGLPQSTYTALGVRACDSARRALFFKSHGPLSRNQKKFYPVWDWNKEKLLTELKRHDIKLPVDYKMFGRTFDGTFYMYIAGIKKYYPADYRRMLDYYPFLDEEVFRHEKRKAAGF